MPGRPAASQIASAAAIVFAAFDIGFDILRWDEAHRVANGYHQLLMKKRVAESILDDCPGISQTRKQALLRKFGSVDRLRKASVEEVAEVDGISTKIAEAVLDFLKNREAPAKGEGTAPV